MFQHRLFNDIKITKSLFKDTRKNHFSTATRNLASITPKFKDRKQARLVDDEEEFENELSLDSKYCKHLSPKHKEKHSNQNS